MQIAVIYLAATLHIEPVDRIGDSRGVRRAIVDGVRNVEEVPHMLIGDLQRRRSRAQIHMDGVWGDRYGPEQPVGVGEDARVEIVDLRREVLKVELTFVDVQSDKAECALVNQPIDADIDALHEAHIHVEEQPARAIARSSSLDLGGADEAVEVVNGRRLFAIRRKHMERRSGEKGFWNGLGRR